jgi:hypothetical protein
MQEGVDMKFVNEMAAISGLMILAIYIFTPTSSATDYSPYERVAETMLLDPTYDLHIISADVSIDTQQVKIDCITDISVKETGAPFGEFATFLGGVLGMYMQTVNAVPEVGDLLIVTKNRNQPTVATFSCPKSWITSLDTKNVDAVNELIYKVFMTVTDVKS